MLLTPTVEEEKVPPRMAYFPMFYFFKYPNLIGSSDLNQYTQTQVNECMCVATA